MPMPPYTVDCSHAGCGQAAKYKIAARWSDGVTQELKTYALSCDSCLADQFRDSRVKQAACRLAGGERLDSPGIFEMVHGRRDQQLTRREDLERRSTT
jgi:hypothetical protein